MRADILTKIEELIKPLTRVSKRWQEHLSQHLDEYMSCLAELSADEDVGLSAINFVQAGMMIESTTRVYAVNVDLLWQFMTEILEVMRMNKKNSKCRADGEENSTNVEDAIRRRKKKAVCADFEEFVPHVIDPDVNTTERNQCIKPMPLRRQVLGKADWKRRKRPYHVYDMEKDTLDLADYSVMYQTSRLGKLQLNMLKELMEDNSNDLHSMQELVHVLELIVRELNHSVVDDADDYSNPPSVAGLSDISTIEFGSAGSHSLELLPVTPPPSPLTVKRSASAPIEGPKAVKRSMSDADSENEVCAGLTTARNSREHLLTITEDPWSPVPLEEGMQEKALNKRTTITVPNNLRPLSRNERKRRSSGEERTKVMINYVDKNMFSVFVKKSRFAVRPDVVMYYVQECQKKKQILKKHSTITLSLKVNLDSLHNLLAENITEDFTGFEDFEADPGEEHGFCGFTDAVAIVNAVPTREDADGDCNNEDNNQIVSVVPALEASCNVPEDPVVDEQPCCSHDVPAEETSDTSSLDDSMHQMVERVAEWERFIRPKLKLAHERGHFDIHSVGSEILESFPGSSGTSIDFRQCTSDKPKADVARYFLAALQLANSYNIEITQSVPGHLSMDCMQLTLKSSIRHHETLEEYEPPSEGANRKRKIITTGSGVSDSESDSENDYNSRNREKRKKR